MMENFPKCFVWFTHAIDIQNVVSCFFLPLKLWWKYFIGLAKSFVQVFLSDLTKIQMNLLVNLIYIYMLKTHKQLRNTKLRTMIPPWKELDLGVWDRVFQYVLIFYFLKIIDLKQTWQNVKVWQTGCWVRRYLLSYPADLRIAWSISQ